MEKIVIEPKKKIVIEPKKKILSPEALERKINKMLKENGCILTLDYRPDGLRVLTDINIKQALYSGGWVTKESTKCPLATFDK